MFNLETKTLNQNGKELPIKQWVVWFQTPIGLVTDYDEAIQRCKECDFDPNAVISPVPVALDIDDRYEIIMRG